MEKSLRAQGQRTSAVSGFIRHLRLREQSPLGSGVRYPKAFALGIALGIAACFGDHLCQIAAGFEGVAQALFEERSLQSATAQFWNSSGAAEQGYALVQKEHACGAGLAIHLGEKT
jgi:hypothetical protein